MPKLLRPSLTYIEHCLRTGEHVLRSTVSTLTVGLSNSEPLINLVLMPRRPHLVSAFVVGKIAANDRINSASIDVKLNHELLETPLKMAYQIELRTRPSSTAHE